MRKKLAILLAICLLFACGSMVVSASENTTYTYAISVKGDWIRTQDAYMPGNVYLRQAGLKVPEDVFIVGKTMYIADTGNARILIYDMEKETTRELGKGALTQPRGLYVTDDGSIYVADGTGEAVVVFDAQGNVKQRIGRPDSYLFSELTDYKPRNVVVTGEGNIFVCSEGTYEGLLQFDSKGEFQGYFAANRKYLSFLETIEDMLLSDSLKQDLLMRRPRAIENLDINERDLVYTVTQTDEVTYAWAAAANKQENCLKQFNLAGANILSRDMFMTDEWNFIDVAAGQYGNAFALTYTGLIYEYDSEGNLIFSFGGSSPSAERSGIFTYSAAIDTDSDGFVYVLDREKGYVQVFYPTDYAVATHRAIHDLENGNYESSEQTWSEVLKLNGSARIAHMGYGKTLFHQQRFEEALEEFRIARSRSYYSDAFWELRDQWLSKNVVYFLVVIFALVVYVIVSSIIKKKKPVPETVRVKPIPTTRGKRFLHDITYFRYMLRHPIDGYYYLKRGQAGSVGSATFLYFVLFIVFAADTLFRGFIFGFTLTDSTPVLFMAISFVVICGLFIIGNYMVASINEGEGSLRNIYTMLPYALSPYLVMTPFIVGSTYILTQNEGFLVSLAWTIAIVWSGALVFIGLTETHNYSFGDTVKNVLLTLFFIVIAIIAAAVMYLLWVQVITFVQDVAMEVAYRVQQA